MEIEEKLDEDFLFYLHFTTVGLKKLENGTQFSVCQAWLHKLCAEVSKTVEEKRSRNIYLSNLVLQMEEGVLKDPFSTMPNPCILRDGAEIFGPQGPTIKEPEWMSEITASGDGDDVTATSLDARTYMATKALPNGKGALGYIAVSMDDEPLQFRGEGFDQHLGQKYEEMVPPISEMERILINRRNPEERDRVLAYYNVALKNIAKQIDGRVPVGSCKQVTNFFDQLINDLHKRGEWPKYEAMPDEQRYLELLYLLDGRLQERIIHIRTREEFLDNIEQSTLRESFFETSLRPEDIFKEHKGSRATKMWEQAIEAGPRPKMIDKIIGQYPAFIIKKFITLIADAKEKLAVKIQRRHENLVSQLKKEMRKEGEKGRKKYDETKEIHDKIELIVDKIKAWDKKAYESEKRREEQLYGHRKEKDEAYEQIRCAMIQAHDHAAQEAEFGHYLTQQINAISETNRIYDQINEESILTMEDTNVATMKNIQRLSRAVKQHENRIKAMKTMLMQQQTTTTDKAASQFLYI